VVLAPEASADVRNQLIGELTNLTRAPDLTAWAERALPRKNQLSIPDAMKVESAFVDQLDRLCQEAPAESCYSACNFDPLSWGIGVQN
jgi:hypothetical protein